MQLKIQVPFQQLLTIVKTLTPSQKARLRKELEKKQISTKENKDEFLDFLLNGPIYNDSDIQVIEENRKSISAWRTKT